MAIKGMQATKETGILLQINTTAMEHNFSCLDKLIDFAANQDAGIMLIYQLIAIGNGEKIKSSILKKLENKQLCQLIADKQNKIKTIIEPVASPQYWPYLLQKKNFTNLWKLKLASNFFHGCAAGRKFAYIKSNGDVWPCPFVEINAGNVRDQHFKTIYTASDVFKNLRNREQKLKGICSSCSYKKICGGCRGRAHIYHGDYLAEDPSCFVHESIFNE
jgi:radical SAM protein with 4Fe4S-binding SPASM domain